MEFDYVLGIIVSPFIPIVFFKYKINIIHFSKLCIFLTVYTALNNNLIQTICLLLFTFFQNKFRKYFKENDK